MKKKLVQIAISILLLFTGCTKHLAVKETGNRASPRRVLIAGHTSHFKESLIEELIKKLEPEDPYVKVIGLRQLAAEDTRDYDAILLITAYRAARISREVRRFLERDPDDPRVIVLYTIHNEERPPPRDSSPVWRWTPLPRRPCPRT